jgi:hypothetical protein
MTFAQNVANRNRASAIAHRQLERQPVIVLPPAIPTTERPRLNELRTLSDLLENAVGRKQSMQFFFKVRNEWAKKCRAENVDPGLSPSEEFVITHLEAKLRTEHMKAAAEMAQMLTFADEPDEPMAEEVDLRNSLAWPV